MPSDENERRYQEIMRRLAARRQQNQQPQPPLTMVLDALNAQDMLAEFGSRHLTARYIVYGPQTFDGMGWQGVMIWYHARGYGGYRVLYLLGIWAMWQDEGITITLGTKTLDYAAPVYTPEAFHKLIRQGFRTYYDDDARPPQADTDILYRAVYDRTQRLEMRQSLAAALEIYPSPK